MRDALLVHDDELVAVGELLPVRPLLARGTRRAARTGSPRRSRSGRRTPRAPVARGASRAASRRGGRSRRRACRIRSSPRRTGSIASFGQLRSYHDASRASAITTVAATSVAAPSAKPAVQPASDRCRTTFEDVPEGDGQEHHAGEREPGDTADREHCARERQAERREVEGLQAAAAPDDERECERREHVEDERVPVRVARLPLRDAVARTAGRRAASGSSGPSRRARTGSRARRAERGRRASALRPSRTTPAGDELERREEHRQERAERDAPVEVRPDDEQRDREVHPARRTPRLAHEQPDEADEEREHEDLRADRPGERRGEDHREEDEHDRARPGAERAGADGGEHEGGEHEHGADEREDGMPAELVGAVGEELRTPLLVDPLAAGADHGQLVTRRKPVLRRPRVRQ